ncbi:uncharacterized protein LOC142972219 isoform X1 [Anticarsia gemmatalis]|uniref:uncharacterized protein LOC142972219 isoform X1 n=1 Tax=Anticarsia gemmatalis TaxID=129554 RepID=UPI003F75FBA8
MSAKENNTKYDIKKSTINNRCIYVMLMTLTLVIASYAIRLGYNADQYYRKYAIFVNDPITSDANSACLSIVVGVLLLLGSIIGIRGAAVKDEFTLTTSISLLLMPAFMSVIVCPIAYTRNVNSLEQNIHINLANIKTDIILQERVDYIQSTLRCCGSSNYTDYIDVEFPNQMFTKVFSKVVSGEIVSVELPVSCCSQPNSEECSIWPWGCKNILADTMIQYETAIGQLALLVIFTCILSSVVGDRLREKYYVRPTFMPDKKSNGQANKGHIDFRTCVY